MPPLWALILLVTLGFNEFLAVLYNPLLLLLLLLAGAFAYTVYRHAHAGRAGVPSRQAACADRGLCWEACAACCWAACTGVQSHPSPGHIPA